VEASEVARRVISRLPPVGREAGEDAIAAAADWPLARGARLLERLGLPVENVP